MTFGFESWDVNILYWLQDKTCESSEKIQYYPDITIKPCIPCLLEGVVLSW